MHHRACSNGQFISQHKKKQTIFFRKWPSTGCLDTHLANSLDGKFVMLTYLFLGRRGFNKGMKERII